MSTNSYILRAVKYFFRLLIFVALLYALLFLTKTARISSVQSLSELFTSWRGIGMFAALFAVSFTYPLFGFVKRRVEGSLTSRRDDILEAFHRGGYSLIEEKDGEYMLFRAFTLTKRIWLMGDDRIALRQDGDGFVIEGVRKDVVYAEFRLRTLAAANGE